LLPAVASQCQTLPVSADHSHSIVNEPFLSLTIQWLIFLQIGNTMKNTMLRKSFKMLEKIAY
jgi:hypothetical protein